MLLQEFPNIDWLREQARQKFKKKKDFMGNPLPKEGWPNVIMNTHTSNVERDSILGPFSVFLNVAGTSKVKVNTKWFSVSSDVYCLSNKGQEYDLHIPRGEKAETFNIHFGDVLYDDVINVLSRKQGSLLDDTSEASLCSFELLPKSAYLNTDTSLKMSTLYQYCQSNKGDYSTDIEFEWLSDLLSLILTDSFNKLRKIENMDALKKATRMELFRRVSMAIDFLHENIFKEVHLDELSSHCGLSKFHLLRVFKEIYGYSPRQYMDQLKLAKAKDLLRKPEIELIEIALFLGFSELSSFSRFFKQRTSLSPNHLRK